MCHDAVDEWIQHIIVIWDGRFFFFFLLLLKKEKTKKNHYNGRYISTLVLAYIHAHYNFVFCIFFGIVYADFVIKIIINTSHFYSKCLDLL